MKNIREIVKGRRWVASIQIGEDVVCLGLFPNKRKAEKAYKIADYKQELYHGVTQSFRYDAGIVRQSYTLYDTVMYGREKETGMFHTRVQFHGDMLSLGRFQRVDQAGLMYDIAVVLKQETEFCRDAEIFKAECKKRLIEVGKILAKYGYDLGIHETIIVEPDDTYEPRNEKLKDGIFRFDARRFGVGLWINGTWVHVGIYFKNRIAKQVYENALSMKDRFTGDVHAFRKLVGAYERMTYCKPLKVAGYEYDRKKDQYVAKHRKLNQYLVLGRYDSPEHAAAVYDAHRRGELTEKKRKEIQSRFYHSSLGTMKH